MTPASPQDWVPLWTAVAAVAASLTALVTIAYTYFTLRLVRSQAEPKVIVYVKHDHERPSVLVIVIENIGRDIAHDVQFTSSRPIPTKAWGIELSSAAKAEVMDHGPLVSGIPALGPGDPRTITWGQYGGLAKAIGTEPITLTYTYRHGRHVFSGETRLEVESYIGTDAHDKPAVVVARSAKEIEGTLKSIAKSLNVIAAKDRDAV
jgi:hypothetical protein